MPAISKGTTLPSNSATIQRTGRTKRSGLPPRQYIFLAQYRPNTSFGNSAASNSVPARPSRLAVAPTYSPLALVTFSNAEILTPAFFAKASAAGVGDPSLKATFHDGPVSF